MLGSAKLSAQLPAFPWDSLAQARKTAEEHFGGIADLSVGTPVDPTPIFIQEALRHAADAHGYPTVWGSAELRSAIIEYLSTRWLIHNLDDVHVLPVIGTKEAVAWLPTHLGLGEQDLVVIPSAAYPTYEVGAKLAGCQVQACDDPGEIQGRASLIWINYPANPHGVIASPELLRRWVNTAREHGAVLASDECYGEFGWEAEPVSILHDDICEGSFDNLLLLHSLSKRSNMAGYRAGYLAGDPDLTRELLEIRRQSGMIVSTPVQAAVIAALGDQNHVEDQRHRYQKRREVLRSALSQAGFRIDHSEGSLYLWATRDEPCRDTVSWFAERGILVAPGDFYGEDRHVRVALTATDERVQVAAQRLEG